MNTSIKSLLAVVALSAAVAAPASANISGQSIQAAVNSAITSGNVNVRVDDGIATLFGWVEDKTTEEAAKRAALSFDNVDRVVDLIVSN